MPVHNKVEIERQAQELLDSKLGADFEIPVDLVELLERMGGELEVRFEGSKDPESLLVGLPTKRL